MDSLDRAVKLLGGTKALGAAVGVVQTAVSNWKSRGNVPAEYCPSIERATRDAVSANPELGDPVTCEELRPDVAWSVLREEKLV